MTEQLYRYMSAAVLAVVSVFAPIQTMIYATVALVIFDFIIGVWAAVKRGEKIRSDKMRKTPVKLATYLMAVMLGFVVEKYLMGGTLPISKIVSGLIGIIEIKSVFENFDTINGGSSVFKAIVARLAPENVQKNGSDE